MNHKLCFGKSGVKVAEADSLSAQGIQKVKEAILKDLNVQIFTIKRKLLSDGTWEFEIPTETSYSKIKTVIESGKAVILLENMYQEGNDPSAEQTFLGIRQYSTVSHTTENSVEITFTATFCDTIANSCVYIRVDESNTWSADVYVPA